MALPAAQAQAGSRGASCVIAMSVLGQHSMPNKAAGCGHGKAHAPSSKPENPPLRLPGADGIPPGPVVLDEREAPPSPLTFPFPVKNGLLRYTMTPMVCRCADRAHEHHQVASPSGQPHFPLTFPVPVDNGLLKYAIRLNMTRCIDRAHENHQVTLTSGQPQWC